MGHFSKEIPLNPDGSLGPVTIRSWYEKEKGSKPVPLEDGAVELVPGKGWDKEQVGIKYELGPDKNRLYITVSLAHDISLSHYLNIILKQKPIQLKVILFPRMPTVDKRPVLGPAEPVVDDVDVTIPAVPQPDIELDIQCSELTQEGSYHIKVTAAVNLPPYISQTDKTGLLKNLKIEVEDPKNVNIKKGEIIPSPSGVTHTLIASPTKKTKTASAKIVSSLSLGDRLLRKERPIKFEPGLHYILNLSTDTVYLDIGEKSYERGFHKIGDPDDGPGRREGSFKASIYEVSSGNKISCHNRSEISVQVPREAKEFLKAHVDTDSGNECFLCKLESRPGLDRDSVVLTVSAKVHELLGEPPDTRSEIYTIPEKPQVTVFLQPPQPVTLTIEKRGFIPCEINITKKYPALARDIVSKGGILEISKIQGLCNLTYPSNGGKKEESFSHTVWYATATLTVGDLLKGTEYHSNIDEESVTIIVRNQNALLPFPENITLELEESVTAKLASIRQELNRYPSQSGSVQFDDLFRQYVEECLRLFASEKNSNLEGGLADTYVQRVANTWAFIRLGNRIYPLLGRTEEISEKAIQRASEYFLNFYLQACLCIVPRIYERLRGYNTPKTAAQIANEAKDIVNAQIKEEYKALFESLQKLKEDFLNEIRVLVRELGEWAKPFTSKIPDLDTQFLDLIQLIKKTVKEVKDLKDPDDIIACLDKICQNYPETKFKIPDLSPSINLTEKDLSDWMNNFIDGLGKNMDNTINKMTELSRFFESLTGIPLEEQNIIRRSLIEWKIKADNGLLEQLKIIYGPEELAKVAKLVTKAKTIDTFIPQLETLIISLQIDPLNYSPSIRDVIEKIRLEVIRSFENDKSIDFLIKYQEGLKSRLTMLDQLDNILDVNQKNRRLINEVEDKIIRREQLEKGFNRVLEEDIEFITDQLVKSQPIKELYNGIVDYEKDFRRPSVLNPFMKHDYSQPWSWFTPMEPGFPGLESSDRGEEQPRAWRDLTRLFQARQDGGLIEYSMIENLFKTINGACINWTLYWKVKSTTKTEEISLFFSRETYEKAKKQYEQWRLEDYYFGMGSKNRQLVELGEELQKINIIPDIKKEHHEVTKKQLDEKVKPLREERTERIYNIFYEAAKGALAPITLSKAPEGVTSNDFGILLETINTISSQIQGFERVDDRTEYYKKLPFWERQVTYLTNGLGEAAAGDTIADVNQLNDWVIYWGTWAFAIGSLAFPIAGAVSWTTMASISAGKEILVDVPLAYFQAVPLSFGELETVSGMYRDLLILYGIAFIGFYVEKVDFNQILIKIEEPDPYIWVKYACH